MPYVAPVATGGVYAIPAPCSPKPQKIVVPKMPEFDPDRLAQNQADWVAVRLEQQLEWHRRQFNLRFRMKMEMYGIAKRAKYLHLDRWEAKQDQLIASYAKRYGYTEAELVDRIKLIRSHRRKPPQSTYRGPYTRKRYSP